MSGFSESERTGISVTIYDLNGRVVRSMTLTSPGTGSTWILTRKNAGLTRGVYLVRVQGRGIAPVTGRFVVR